MCDTCFNLNSLWSHKNQNKKERKEKTKRQKNKPHTNKHTHTRKKASYFLPHFCFIERKLKFDFTLEYIFWFFFIILKSHDTNKYINNFSKENSCWTHTLNSKTILFKLRKEFEAWNKKAPNKSKEIFSNIRYKFLFVFSTWFGIIKLLIPFYLIAVEWNKKIKNNNSNFPPTKKPNWQWLTHSLTHSLSYSLSCILNCSWKLSNFPCCQNHSISLPLVSSILICLQGILYSAKYLVATS